MHKAQAGILHTDAYCVPRGAANPDGAWKFIEFALGAKGSAMMAATGRTVPSVIAVAQRLHRLPQHLLRKPCQRRSAIQPNDTYYQSTTAGAHEACLDGPDGTNFNLHLQRWNGSSWADVASVTTAGSDETINYSGAAGYYQYRVVSVSGSGAYTLGLRRPS